MSKTSSVKLAVVGCGAWGKNIVRNFHELGCLAAISDLYHDTAVELSTKYNVHNYTFDQILSDPEINAVAIVTPAETHYSMAQKALEAGKHIYVEKPLTMDTKQAEDLVQLAASKNKIIMTGHLLQYHPAFIQLKKMVENKELGNLRYIYSNRLSLGRVRSEENCLWDLAPHDFSMILSLINEEPMSIRCEDIASQEKGILDTVTTFLTFPSGAKTQVFVSWIHPFKEQKLVVIGDKGMAVFDDLQDWDNKLVFYSHYIEWAEKANQANIVKATPTPVAIQKDEPLRLECQHFIDCIIQNKAPRTDGAEAIRVVRALQHAQESIKSNTLEKQSKVI